ncbi:MAG: hypothetical protein HKN88_05480 [Gammaproteobacteria bacterium]|nr:hypothetical protein [Gammaproteobacteria bacterium]NNC97505.1 hypothetical protein [Gammaproteobacteria bacterium]NNM14221.1 hypothetical protein [Gammaproteobacteria bacterium]
MLVSLAMLSACSTGNQHSGNSEPLLVSSDPDKPMQVSHTLDGQSYDGSIRAKGIMGLISVKGTLSFDDGMLVWEAKGSKDTAPYETLAVEGGMAFAATAVIENNETVAWSGIVDGDQLKNARAIWTRQKGDLVHDLLLPDQVTMLFTPKE